MQSLKLADHQELTKDELIEARMPMSFTKRHSGLESTSQQKQFDWTFGVGVPLICVAADPFVFAGQGAMLGEYKIFAYVLSIVSIMSMAAWLLWGQKLGDLRPYIGGLFLAGSVISLIVGVILIPYSLMGMFILIGLLGFTPLISSFVYLRNGLRAISGAKLELPTDVVYRAVVISALYTLIVPFVLNF